MVGEEVGGCAGTHVEEEREGEVVVFEGREGCRLDDLLDNTESIDTSLEVERVLKVVECDGGVVIRVGVYEFKVALGEGASNFFENESTSE